MRTRHEDALFIQEGACNPVAIAGTIHRHMLEMMKTSDHTAIREDSAIRLMIHQLAFLCHVQEMDHPPYCDTYMKPSEPHSDDCGTCRFYQKYSYNKAMNDCRAQVEAAQ